MREIAASQITETVERLCIQANNHLPQDVKEAICRCRREEDWETAQESWTELLRILRLRMNRRYPSVRIQGWPVYSWRSGRMYISPGETWRRLWMRECAADMKKDIFGNPW